MLAPRPTCVHLLLVLASLGVPACRNAPARDSVAANPLVRSPARAAPIEAYPWVPDRGDGTYRNPVLFADYSDPDVLRVGDEYYLTASSFQLTPGLPLLRSHDLVNWTIVGYALTNLPHPRYDDVQAGAGVWAPSLRAHGGIFYIFAPLPDEGIYVLTATQPEGPWSEPRLLLEGKGLIDPCPLWDDDGKAYLVHAYARSRAGIKDRLRVVPMAPDASGVIGQGQIVFHDPERLPTLEGPKFYKRNGWYYILAPAGGVRNGWQVALRAHSVFGPYEDRIVLEQGGTAINGPHQGALVDSPSGAWWFVHFQDAGIYGRVVHLNPVTWQDDWPLMGMANNAGQQEPVLAHAKPVMAATIEVPATSDEFDGSSLGLQWQWYANHQSGWYSLHARPGFLRLFAHSAPRDGDLAHAPNLLLQKLPARAFVAETEVELGDGAARAGLVVMGESHAALVVERDDAGQRVTLSVDNRAVRTAHVGAGPVHLRVAMADGGACRFFYRRSGDREATSAGEFQARAGRWIGARVGIFALRDADSSAGAPLRADFDYFHFTPPGAAW
jgi:beta-xylosidase